MPGLTCNSYAAPKLLVKKIPGARTVFVENEISLIECIVGDDECCEASRSCADVAGCPMNYHYTIVTLSELLAVTRDGENGFVTCAEHARSNSLRRLFMTRASRHAVASAELGGLIGQLGGDPAIRGKILSTTRRGWVTLPATLAQNNDDALVDEC